MKSIVEELTRFDSLMEKMIALEKGEKIISDGLCYWGNEKKQKERIDLTLMGAVHGNEIIGLFILCELFEKILKGDLQPKINVAFILGNREALKQDVRFTEKDLNRSFQKNKKHASSHEERRAHEIESILEKTSFLVDFHQTQTPTHRAFFVLNYTRKSHLWARFLNPEIPIINFKEGMKREENITSTIFTNHAGGAGITLELGEKGFEEKQLEKALKVALQGINSFFEMEEKWSIVEKKETGFIEESFKHHHNFYCIVEKVEAPSEEGDLHHDIINFSPVKKGDALGVFEGEELVSLHDGVVIFPKYNKGRDKVKRDKKDPICSIASVVDHF